MRVLIRPKSVTAKAKASAPDLLFRTTGQRSRAEAGINRSDPTMAGLLLVTVVGG